MDAFLLPLGLEEYQMPASSERLGHGTLRGFDVLAFGSAHEVRPGLSVSTV